MDEPIQNLVQAKYSELISSSSFLTILSYVILGAVKRDFLPEWLIYPVGLVIVINIGLLVYSFKLVLGNKSSFHNIKSQYLRLFLNVVMQLLTIFLLTAYIKF
ncbi:MAG: hypothetical protein RLZ47_253 [Bacteroidota bacterium]|jgi:hypothetical protein